ncbi:MAG: phytase [Rhizobacter sp.]|nr:phytase [Rhizobacter sp.]
MSALTHHPLFNVLAGLLLAASAANAAAATSLPAASAGATEFAALPGGAWLVLGKKGLALIGADGQSHQQLPLRGELLDLRAGNGSATAMLLDSNTERVLPLRIDLTRNTWRVLDPLPDSTGAVSALCLYRDPQGHDHGFVIGKDGLAQQWVLHGDGAQLVRRLAVSPQAESCRVDDATAQLFVSGPDGVWAHRADPEGSPTREPVLLLRPHGPLRQAGGPLAVLPGGVVVADADAGRLLFMQHKRSAWRQTASQRLPATSDPDSVAAWPTAGGWQLAVRDDRAGRWSAQAVPRPLAKASELQPALPVVKPRVQTAPVAQFGDAADDPAIWRHATDATRSLVLATDKKRGLAVYDLLGRERQFLPVGRVNNVDLRQAVLLGNERIDIAAATQRDDNTVLLWRIGAEGELSELARLPTGFNDIYGICLHRNPAGALEVFVNDKSGAYQQLRVERRGDEVVGAKLREFKLASQPEGCVADDEARQVFLGEEKRGVWALPTDARSTAKPQLVLPVGGLLHADVEGMGLYRGATQSWLVVSSQGNNSFVVLDAAPPYRVRGAFRIGMNLDARIDGVSETDGLDVSSASFGPGFERGLLVVQDGFKQLPSGPQNFKYVSWDDVAEVLKLK